MSWIGTKIDLVMPLVDIQCLGQLAGTGTKPPNVFQIAPLSHEAESLPRFDRPDQNETIARATFNENVQHPVNAVIEIDVGGAGLVSLNKSSRARAAECVCRFIAHDQIRFGLNDEPGTSFPNELCADQILRALERIDLEKTSSQHAGTLAERLGICLAGGTCSRLCRGQATPWRVRTSNFA